MAFKVSCGGCHVGGSGYKISLEEKEVDSASLGVGWVGLNRGFTSYAVVNIVLPVKVGVD